MVRDRRGGPQHPRRHAALHGRARRRPARGRGPRGLARHLGLAAAPDRGRDPRGRVGARGGLTAMAIPTASAPVVLEPASQAFVEATAKPPFLYELTPAQARSRARRRPVRPHREAARRGALGHRAGRRRRRAGADRAAPGRRREAARDPVHARRRLGARQRPHARPARPRARGRRRRGASCSSSTTAPRRRATRWRSSRATRSRSGSCARAPPTRSTPHRMAVAGDSVGGCMTAALTLMADDRGDVRFVHQSLYYPVTDAAMDTPSYEQFAEGYHLTAKAMAWFWDAYAPDLERRSEPYASPLRGERRAARRAPAGVRDRRRGRRPARRGRGLRRASAGGRGGGDHGPLRRHHRTTS